jgi:hypothetical protein
MIAVPMVFDVWDSRESSDASAGRLPPTLSELGITSARPSDVMPVVNVTQ